MGSAPRILGVDDNPRNLVILRKSLSDEFELVTAGSGEEALELAVRLHPELILLDVTMPGIDGYETCRRLRATPELKGVKIIMVSARGSTTDRLEGYAAGANDYVVKPFDEDELNAKIRVYLQLKSMEEVDGLKSELLALLSHETGTPLSGIIGGLELLGDTSLTPDQKEFINIAKSSAEWLSAMVRRVSLIAELKTGSVRIARNALDLRALAGDSVNSAQECARQAGVTLAFETGAEVPTIGNAPFLRMVLDALLDNAIRMSPRNAIVTARVWSEGALASFSVEDHGPGIETKLKRRIFDGLVVGDIQHHQRGSGLSLAIARLIAEHHNGQLTVESALGQGATFRLDLPVAAAAVAA